MVLKEQDNNEWFCGLLLWSKGCAVRGLKKKITLTFQRYAILDARI